MGALFSALAVVILYFASVWPTGQPGLAAAASMFVAAMVIESGPVPGVFVFVVSSALAMLLLPNRSAAILYISFFGFYPIVKSFIERLRGTVLQWALKLAVFNISLTVVWFILRELFFDFGSFAPHIILIYIGGNAVFALFDYGFTKVIRFYINRIRRDFGGLSK